MATTRDRLRDAALVVLARDGISGASARTIATQADANQALVFYHYGSVDELLAEASRHVTRHRAETYAARLGETTSFRALAEQARRLHHEEREAGNLAILRQLLAAAQTRPQLRPALHDNFALLAATVEETLRRLLADSAIEDVVDPRELARSVAGGFLGLQLLDEVITDVTAEPFAGLELLADLVDHVLTAGTLETTLLRRRLRGVGRG